MGRGLSQQQKAILAYLADREGDSKHDIFLSVTEYDQEVADIGKDRSLDLRIAMTTYGYKYDLGEPLYIPQVNKPHISNARAKNHNLMTSCYHAIDRLEKRGLVLVRSGSWVEITDAGIEYINNH